MKPVAHNTNIAPLRHPRVCGALWTIALIMVVAVPLMAHHSFAAEYDATKPVTLTGTIAKVEWTNPHIRFYIDVKGADHRVERWEISGPSVNALTRSGTRSDALKVGQTVTVQGFLAKTVKNLANLRSVKSTDGKILIDRLGDQQ